MGDKLKSLSQAIRLGATFRPQARCMYFGYSAENGLGSCAIGAAYEAVTGETEFPVGQTITKISGLFDRLGVPKDYHGQIAIMNDHQGKTREEIADWLQSQGY